MRRARLIVLGALALGVPVVLAVAAYVLAVRFGVSTSVPALPAGVHRADDAAAPASRSPSPSNARRDRCAEPEHAGDPSCTSARTPAPIESSGKDSSSSSGDATSDDHGGGSGSSSGSGSSGSGDSLSSGGSGSSGSGSGSSGSGSGSGSGDSGSSGGSSHGGPGSGGGGDD